MGVALLADRLAAPAALIAFAACSGLAIAQPEESEAASQQADVPPETTEATPTDEPQPLVSEPGFGPGPIEEAGRQVGPPGVAYRLNLGGEYQFAADFDQEGEGDIAIGRVHGGFDIVFTNAWGGRLITGFETEASVYEWSRADAFFGGPEEPFKQTFEYSLNGFYTRNIDDRWAFFVGANVTSAMEDGADFSDSLTFGGLGGASYQINEDFRLGLGLGVGSRLEDNANVFPLISIDWRIDDRWALTSEGGLGLKLSYDVDPQLELSARARYESREYRLDNGAALSEGVARDKSVPVVLGALWRSEDRRLELNAEVGAVVYQEFEFLDSTGTIVEDTDVDPTLFLSAEIRFTF